MIDRKKFKGKLLFWDIETSLISCYTHSIGSNVYLRPDQIIKDKRIICISYIAEGWKKPRSLHWGDSQDDKKLLVEFSEIAKQYDVLVAQNGDSFDVKVFQGRLWAEDLPPLNNLLTLDTLKMSRSSMKLTSHSLGYILKQKGLDAKHSMSFDDWVAVEEGDKERLKKMVRYCERDTTGLQEIFWSLLPYVNKLPVQLGVLLSGDRDACPKCSATEIKRNGTRPSSTGLKQRWYCGGPTGCGHDWTDTRLKTTTDKLVGGSYD